jgi:pyrroloquinoline quinone biosynthesis protein B
MMRIKVLGSAAGGGFPQWNCNAPTSRAARQNTSAAKPRSQSSLAVSADGARWIVFNASPDLRQQIAATPQLQPRADGPLRASPIHAVVLTNADVDHVAGLLNLRERQPFTLYGTDRVLSVLAANSIFNVLDPAYVTRTTLPLDAGITLSDGGQQLGIDVIAFPVPGKVALYLEEAGQPVQTGTRTADTIGLEVRDHISGRSFFYIPGCAEIDSPLADRIRGAALVFFDGTLFSDDELIQQGLGQKTGRRMGHISMSGPDGSIEAFEKLDVTRRIFVHMNTSNPALIDGSSEHRLVQAAGWTVAHDGLELEL